LLGRAMRRGSRLARLEAGLLACALALGLAATGFVGCPGRAPRRSAGSTALRRAGPAAGGKDSMDDMYVDPDKLISDDQMGMDEDFDEQYIEEPPEELLDAWEKDEAANDVLKQFQDGELEGKDVMKFRDVYKLLAVMGLDHTEFTMMFTESDPDFDDFDDDPDYDFVGDDETLRSPRGGAGPPGGRFDEDPYGERYPEPVGAPGGPGGGGRGGGRGRGGGGRGGP